MADFNKVNEKIGKACAVATKSNALSRRTSDQMSDFSKHVTARNSNSLSPSRNQVIQQNNQKVEKLPVIRKPAFGKRSQSHMGSYPDKNKIATIKASRGGDNTYQVSNSGHYQNQKDFAAEIESTLRDKRRSVMDAYPLTAVNTPGFIPSSIGMSDNSNTA